MCRRLVVVVERLGDSLGIGSVTVITMPDHLVVLRGKTTSTGRGQQVN